MTENTVWKYFVEVDSVNHAAYSTQKVMYIFSQFVDFEFVNFPTFICKLTFCK